MFLPQFYIALLTTSPVSKAAPVIKTGLIIDQSDKLVKILKYPPESWSINQGRRTSFDFVEVCACVLVFIILTLWHFCLIGEKQFNSFLWLLIWSSDHSTTITAFLFFLLFLTPFQPRQNRIWKKSSSTSQKVFPLVRTKALRCGRRNGFNKNHLPAQSLNECAPLTSGLA